MKTQQGAVFKTRISPPLLLNINMALFVATIRRGKPYKGMDFENRATNTTIMEKFSFDARCNAIEKDGVMERGPVHEVVHGQGWRAVEQMHRAMHGFGLWHEYGTVQRQGPVSENERTMWSQGGTTEVERRQQGAQKGVGRMPEIYNKDVTRRLQGCHRDAMRRSRASREPVAI